MRELIPSKRGNSNDKEIQIQNSENMKIVLNIIDNFIAGQRFGELDSGKQMYLLSCQEKIDNMQRGYYNENDVIFLKATINSLMTILTAAGIELDNIFWKGELRG